MKIQYCGILRRLWRAMPLVGMAVVTACDTDSTHVVTDDQGFVRPEGELAEPGEYLSPLVQLQRMQGIEDHLHVDEVRLRPDGLLLQCSYTFGVVDATVASDMEYLSQNLKHTVPGDERTPGCLHLGWEGNTVYTTHRGNIRNPAFLSGWDITDPEQPVQLPVLQEPGVNYEGVDVANGNVFVGLHDKGLGVYRRNEVNELTRVGTATGFVNAWGVVARDNTVFVADGVGGLVTVDATDPTNPVVLGQVTTGGQARGLVLDGDIAYVASGSAGVSVIDISDLANPTVVATIGMPGTALRVDYSAGHLFVAAWNDARVYDVSDPRAARFVGAVRLTHELNVEDGDRPPSTSRVLGIAARDNDIFVGNWHVLYSYRLFPDRLAPNIRLPEAAGMLDLGSLEPGQTATVPFEITNQGTADLTLVDAWTSGSAFEVTPRTAKIAAGETMPLSVTFRPSTPDIERSYLQLLSDDPVAPLRQAYLVGNQPGIGIGTILPETTGAMLDGSSWSSTQAQLDGQVMLIEYFATFCPVCGGQLPDVEERFWRKYRDQGLLVVGLNAHDAVEQVGAVDQYCESLRLTFPLGLEPTKTTYQGVTENYKGLNPFPVDVIVGKDGKIAYIAREYDPDAMTEIIERLLAE